MIVVLTYSYKTINSDFRVTEIINLILDGGDYHYYIMRKKGYKTVDVLDLIAAEKNLEIADISYAGLKDEDAITTQYIAVKDKKIENLSRVNGEQDFSISYVGSANVPMQIGKLQGNSFRIRLRNLDLNVAKKVCAKEKHAFSVINYFDTQRFGMPELPKLSHKIGKCLLVKDYDLALRYLRDSGNIDEIVYKKWENSPEEYIRVMEIRRKTFFLSAYDSFVWNNNIAKAIGGDCGKKIIFNKEGIDFTYVTLIDDKIRNILNESDIVWHRYDENGYIFEKKSFRQPYLEVLYRASEILPDDINMDRNMVDIDFILPAGVYATNVIDQIMCVIENEYHTKDTQTRAL